MILLRLACLGAMFGLHPAVADTVVAARTIPGKTVLAPGDVTVIKETVVGALSDPAGVFGREARFVLYAGQPIRASDLAAPALIERNAPVTLVFEKGGLRISAEGRALGRAAAGEMVRVMNMASRQTVTGRVSADGRVIVGRQHGG